MLTMLKTYRQILETANLHVTEDDCVSTREEMRDGTVKHIPLTIKGQRVVVPSAVQMKNPDWEHRVAFHPFSENPGRGESEIMERLRGYYNYRLNTVYPLLLVRLLTIGSSTKDHDKLSPEQAEVLPLLKNADEKTVADFISICANVPNPSPTKAFISLFLRRSAKLDGKDYFRAGVIAFPFYAEFLKDEAKIAGVALRKKDRATLKALMDYVLPHQDETQYYSRGSNSRVAVSCDAVMKAMLAIVGPLNDVIDRFQNLLPENLNFPTEWAETFDNIEALSNEIRELPMLRGNEGHHPEALARAAEAAQVTEPTLQQPFQQPTYRPSAPQQQQQPNNAFGVPGMGSGNTMSQPPQQAVGHPQFQQHQPQHQQAAQGRTTDLSAFMRAQGVQSQQQQHNGWNQPQQTSTRATLSNPNVSRGWGSHQQSNGWGNQYNPVV